MLLISMFLIAMFPQPTPVRGATFIFAGWDYPDEHNQGLDAINVYENSTGSWVLYSHPSYGNSIEYDDSGDILFNWTDGVFMKIRAIVTLNATVTGAASVADGQNYLRLSVNISSAGVIVFSQQNFTYVSGNDFGLYWYDYDCIFNFLPQAGAIYTVTVTYEIFYEDQYETSGDTNAASGDTNAAVLNSRDITVLASAGSTVGTTLGYYTYTHTINSAGYEAYDDSAPYLAIMYLNFTIIDECSDANMEINCYGFAYPATTAIGQAWNGTDWETLGTFGPFAYHWTNLTVPYSYVVYGILMFRIYITAGASVGIDMDYVEVFYQHDNDYTDTYTINTVSYGGTHPSELNVDLWFDLPSGYIPFNFSAYWNSAEWGEIQVYDFDQSDFVTFIDSPNGIGGSLAWDTDTIDNEDYYNTTHIGFRFHSSGFGDREINIDYIALDMLLYTPEWFKTNEVTFIFYVEWNPAAEFGFDLFFIFLGLIMMPVSTMYLVRGGRQEMSRDKLFLGLVIFFVGWGLLVGGIMP